MSKYDRKALSPAGLHYDGEQLTFKKYISKHTGREKKNGFVIFVLQKIAIYLTKNVLKTTRSNVKCHISI